MSTITRAPSPSCSAKSLPTLGFYGKVPSRGDFVGRSLPDLLREGLDQWLQTGLTSSKRRMGKDWLPSYLNAPLWRFVIGPGVLGSSPAIGVLMASVDRVGRYFPLVVAVDLPDCAAPSSLLQSAAWWYESVEHLALSTLEDDFDFEAFSRAIEDLSPPPYDRATTGKKVSSLPLALSQEDGPEDAYRRMLEHMITAQKAPYSLWLSKGSETISPSLLMAQGMPPAASFAGFLDGQWQKWGWQVQDNASPLSGFDDLAIFLLSPTPALPSAARSHSGTIRQVNEDAFLCRPEIGIWAVADGVGGHEKSQYASQTVIASLEAMLPPLSAGGALQEIEERLNEAHGALRTQAITLGSDAIVASTVVVLFIYGTHYSVVWSGDSRAYLLREGVLSQISRDHSAPENVHMVTQAVGVGSSLKLEAIHGVCQPGDRFLLCSDGLSDILSNDDLREDLLSTDQPEEIAASLLEEALIAGAHDNVTLVVAMVPNEDSQPQALEEVT